MTKPPPSTPPAHSKIKGDPKSPEARHHGKRPTPERPPAPRVKPKRRES